MKKTFKWLGAFTLILLVSFVAYIGFTFWNVEQENKISKQELYQLYDKIKIGMSLDDLAELIDPESSIRAGFYWDEEKIINMPRPPEFSDAHAFPNNKNGETAYSVIGLCLTEVGIPVCKSETAEDELSYIGLVLGKAGSHKSIFGTGKIIYDYTIKQVVLLQTKNGHSIIIKRIDK